MSDELVELQQGGEVSFYDIASQALASAVSIDEVKSIHDKAEQFKLYARQSKDRELIANASALIMRSRRRLGEMLIAAREAGQLSAGGRKWKGARPEGYIEPATLKEVGVDKKLSSEAQKLAAYPEDDFEAVVEKAVDKIKAGRAIVINPAKDLDTQDKALHRAIREAQLAARQKDLGSERHGVIYADPEWPFEVWSAAGMSRSADNHYPTSALEVIEARDVPAISADDCVLFLWVTAPHHAAGNGAMIMRAWGFEPRAEIIWDKVEPGTGFWFRNQHEVLLVGVKGNVPAPAMGTQWPSLIRSPKAAHSEKPDWAYELIEQYYPSLKKIELNARRRRDGWNAWGFEAPEDEVSPGDGSLGEVAQVYADQIGARADDASASSDAIRQDDPADAAGPEPRPLPSGRSLSETGVDQSSAEGVGEGSSDDALPHSTVAVAALSGAQKNDIIRAGYERDMPIAELMVLTGLGDDAIKKRAGRMKLGSRDRQRRMARAFTTKQHAERRADA